MDLLTSLDGARLFVSRLRRGDPSKQHCEVVEIRCSEFSSDSLFNVESNREWRNEYPPASRDVPVRVRINAYAGKDLSHELAHLIDATHTGDRDVNPLRVILREGADKSPVFPTCRAMHAHEDHQARFRPGTSDYERLTTLQL